MEVSFADDTYNLDASSANIQFNSRYPLTSSSLVAGGLGYYHAIDVLDYDYLYWNLGYTYNFSRNFSVDARYFGTREGSRYEPHHYFGRQGLEIENSRYVLTFSLDY
jgi:predicted porin